MIFVYLFITTHTLDWSIHVYDEACTHKQIYQELKCPTSWDQWDQQGGVEFVFVADKNQE